MRLGFLGKDGVGKSTLAALIARDHALDAFDADPLEGLTEIYPKAKKYEGFATDPAVIDFALLERSFGLLARDPAIKVVVVATPHRHVVKASRGILETLSRYCPNEVMGIVVNMSDKKLAEKVSNELNLKLIGCIPLATKLDDHLLDKDITGFSDRQMRGSVAELSRQLGLQKRAAPSKKSFFRWG